MNTTVSFFLVTCFKLAPLEIKSRIDLSASEDMALNSGVNLSKS